MVNLNAPRNLPPDNTPWGKAIERRLSILESTLITENSDFKNISKGLNALNTRVGSLNVQADVSNGWSRSISSGGELSGDNVYSDRYADVGITIPVPRRTKRVFVSGLVNIYYSGSGSPSIEIIPFMLPESVSRSAIDWDFFVGDSMLNSTTTGESDDGVPIAAYIERESFHYSSDQPGEIGAVAHITNTSSGILSLQSARLIAITF